MKTKLLLFVTICSAIWSAAYSTESEPNDTPAQATVLTLNGSNTGAITPTTDLDYWKVTTTSDGLLALTLTSNDAVYLDMHIFDNNGTTELNSVLVTNSTGTLSTDGLAAGTYYVLVEIHFAGQTNTGYTLSNVLTPAPVANDIEPNNDRAHATVLGKNATKTGHVNYYYNLHRDSSDWYKVTTNLDGALKLILSSSNAQYIDCQLYDNNGTTVLNASFTTNSSTSQTTDGLAAGTYFMKLTNHFGNGFIPYTITDSLLLPAVANDAEPNNSRTLALALALNGSASGHCDYYYNLKRDSSDWYTFTTNSDGAVKLILKSWNGQYIDCQLYDNDGIIFLNTFFTTNTTVAQTTDGLATGTYYLKLTNHFGNGFIPYTITDSLIPAPVANDIEPNGSRALAKTLAVGGSTTGHVDYYYNNLRDSSDWYKLTTPLDGMISLTLTSSNGQYVDATLYDNDGVTPLNSTMVINSTGSQNTDGLGAGTYYIRIFNHFGNGFIPYTLSDNLSTYVNANDLAQEPNDIPHQAKTMPANGTITGHVDFYYNLVRNTTDWWKVNYTGSGSLTLTLGDEAWLINGSIPYVDINVYKDTTASPIYSNLFNATSTIIPFTGLTQGYYWIKLNSHFANQQISYSLNASWIQIAKAKITLVTATIGTTCTNASLKYKCSKSSPPYTVQLFRYGVKYGSALNVNNTSAFTIGSLPPGNYYATVYGDGATGSAKGTSPVSTLVPVPTNPNTTTIRKTKATLNWDSLSCIKYDSIYYRVQGALTWTKLKTATSHGSFTLTGLTGSTTYEWEVAHVDTGNLQTATSAYTAIVTFTTSAMKLGEDDALNTEDAISVYPNPTADNVHVSFENTLTGTVTMRLMDVTGRVMFSHQQEFSSGVAETDLDISSLSSGMYMLQIIAADGKVFNQQVIKMKE